MQRNQLFENKGSGSFTEVGKVLGAGMLIEKSSRGAAFGDLDNDGDLDVLVVNMDDTPTLLRNDGGNRQNWLMVKLVDRGSNVDAIGARVVVRQAGHTQTREVHSGTGYISQDDIRLHFGLGKAAEVEQLDVRWPSGEVESLRGIAANRLITIRRGEGIVAEGFNAVIRGVR